MLAEAELKIDWMFQDSLARQTRLQPFYRIYPTTKGCGLSILEEDGPLIRLGGPPRPAARWVSMEVLVILGGGKGMEKVDL